MTKRKRAEAVVGALGAAYPDVKCFLNYERPWQLLVATMLSAQCTDERVNLTTPGLFARYGGAAALAGADTDELEGLIKPCGFYHTKARHIREAARLLAERHGGEPPRTIEELTALPGVGRKTANVILGNIYGIPGVVVDTHVGRVSLRLGLCGAKDPVKAEFELMAVLPKSAWIAYNHQIIAHGRAVCKAPKPKCEGCCLSEWCFTNNNS